MLFELYPLAESLNDREKNKDLSLRSCLTRAILHSYSVILRMEEDRKQTLQPICMYMCVNAICRFNTSFPLNCCIELILILSILF